ncbi:MAG: PKD domain-containing protein [Nitrososphaerota archaeon]|nr:PKD domain-containing protein [Nitrososphaerota archaeon]
MRGAFDPSCGRWSTILLVSVLLALIPPAHASSPTPSFSVSISATPASGPAPLFVDFSVLVLSGTPTAYDWDFGDGHYLNGSASPQNASPAHEYLLADTYDVSVTVWEGSAFAESSPLAIDVGSAPLLVSIHASPQQGAPPLRVLFNASAAGGTGTFVSFTWSFGDGGSAAGPVVYHTFSSPGSYHVHLTVTDSSDGKGNATAWVNVTTSSTAGASGGGSDQVPYFEIALAFGAGIVVATLLVGWMSRRERRLSGPGTGVFLPSVSPPSLGEKDVVGASPPEEGEAPALSPPVTESPVPVSDSADERAGLDGPQGEVPAVKVEDRGTPPVTLSQRVIVHLAEQGILAHNEIAPREFTQSGMASAIKVRQNVLTTVLKRLESNGVLVSETTHVKGEFRRLKVYRLTSKGEALAREYRRNVRPRD